MTRREALKSIGLAIGTATVGLRGVSGLTSCSQEKKRLVFYFTGTGNSLYVARVLGGEHVISIPQALKNGVLEYEADEIGIVYPVYGHMPPNIVKEFLKAARLKADYFFAVLTYGNNRGASPEVMNEQIKIDKKIPEQLERIKTDLAAYVGGMDEITDQDRQFTAGFLQWTGMNKEDGFKYETSERFHIDPNKCIECSTCTGVCPRGNYEYGSQGLTVSGQCDYCLACIPACPQKAISFKPSDQWLLGPERNPDARYRNPNISLNDIINSNRQ